MVGELLVTARSLVITHTFPWPAQGGGAIRAGLTVEALARLGPVDVVSILSGDVAGERSVPPGAPVGRVLVLDRPPRTVTRWKRAPWLVTSRLPSRRVADYRQAQARFAAWAGDYDIAWLGCGTEAFIGLAPTLRPGMPIVANLDDIEDRKIESQRAAGELACVDGSKPRSAALRQQADRLLARVEIRRWRTLHTRMAQSVDRVVVCSDVDKAALTTLGITNVVVIPNVYPAPTAPAGRLQVGDPPTMSLVGTLHYPPNADAARFMVGAVLPAIRARIPSAQLRLVGRPDAATVELERAPGVVATGLVDDLTTELARADVAVVPIRFGSGTRIKILEAFAHNIPVVSTVLGAEGLDVADRRELLLADDPSRFANKCVDALTNAPLRQRLVANAHAYWKRHHQPDVLHDRVTAIANELTISSGDLRSQQHG